MSDKKIKILFRHRSMEMGGVEKVILSLLNNLDRDKFDLTICLNLNQGELRNDIPKHVKKVFLTKGKEDFSKNFLLQKFQLIIRNLKLKQAENNPQIAQKLLNDNFDIEIAPTYSSFSSVLNSSNRNSKKIGWFHSDISFPKLQPLVPKILEQIPQFDYFIWGSKQANDVFVETYPTFILPENEVILNAIPIKELKLKAEEFPVNFTKKTFVSVGRLHTRKGFHKLLEAHSNLLKEGFDHEIIIIGDGEERQNLEKQAQDLGVSGSFKFLGTLLNPYPYVKNGDFFILPSESEGWPLIIAEALILQKPIIATNVGGIPEMIIDKENGLLIEYEISVMQNAMKLFLTDEILILEIKENLKKSESQFDNKKIFESVENILIKLAKAQ
ncbi:glycosyltransferase [Halpernia frigidisoli]|uniref:Glycosyltransferase involved in cell wall bisynthesis n=1 Tax=Halpernia frigidisoli TaxID=1125876 RepID=A0A1I3GMB0_9FLAO|nr:glycosyltransferase [Halpernia frigidisoli]SFI24597.1 Glycosyltransferase involved in cell wall bisynthesis [Halpernia frigidisoli]